MMDLFDHAIQRDYGKESTETIAPVPDPTEAKDREQEFNAWKDTPGGRRIMKHMHSVAYFYGKRFEKEGRRVSARLIFEIVRDRLPVLRQVEDKQGVIYAKYKGFSINNDFAPYVADHIEDRHPAWSGMFEKRARTATKPIREVA